MSFQASLKLRRTWSLVALLAVAANAQAQRLAPIVYTISAPVPESHIAVVDAQVPTERKATIELMMPVWSPGFYRVEDYAGKVQDLSARTPDGAALIVEQPQKNRWRIHTGGAPVVVLSYRLLCTGRSVTTDWVGEDFGVFNGSATFITLAENARRPHEVRLTLPAQWPQSMTSLAAAPDGIANHYRADDYDTLNDSPILAGKLSVHEFTVAGSTHFLVDAGTLGEWDGALAARSVEQFVRANYAFWGFVPFRKYVFLNLFRQGGGGLEHLNSTLLTSRFSAGAPGGNLRWLNFVSHEYFHAFNVKRLRPVELGPFDYERPPSTTSLWVSEGLTSYYGELMVARSGLETPADYLASLSSHITSVQASPGRLVQTLDQSSLDVWTAGTSGVGQDPKTTVSYYEKGPIVGFLLDARIRRLTKGKRSLDDVMRLAYKRYSGRQGFTADQFRATAEEIAGTNLKDWFHRALASTEELDYAEALDWFGLRFAAGADAASQWKLEARPDATDAQKANLLGLVGVHMPGH
jgi:predicted metalloprotease with PDZ domain